MADFFPKSEAFLRDQILANARHVQCAVEDHRQGHDVIIAVRPSGDYPFTHQARAMVVGTEDRKTVYVGLWSYTVLVALQELFTVVANDVQKLA